MSSESKDRPLEVAGLTVIAGIPFFEVPRNRWGLSSAGVGDGAKKGVFALA
jgi:hypothetical protein